VLNLCPCQVLLLVPKEVFHIKKKEKERKRQVQNKKEPHKKEKKIRSVVVRFYQG
jgi:hypothetical protein